MSDWFNQDFALYKTGQSRSYVVQIRLVVENILKNGFGISDLRYENSLLIQRENIKDYSQKKSI